MVGPQSQDLIVGYRYPACNHEPLASQDPDALLAQHEVKYSRQQGKAQPYTDHRSCGAAACIGDQIPLGIDRFNQSWYLWYGPTL